MWTSLLIRGSCCVFLGFSIPLLICFSLLYWGTTVQFILVCTMYAFQFLKTTCPLCLSMQVYFTLTCPQSTQRHSHLSLGRLFAVSTFFICGFPESFSWLSTLSPAVGIPVREFILRSLQKWLHTDSLILYGTESDTKTVWLKVLLTGWWAPWGWGTHLCG